LKPTDEQLAIVQAARRGGPLRVQAFAGTGKTATLRLVAEDMASRGRRGLYIAFNRSVKEEGIRRFAGLPVQIMTAHGVAYAATGMRDQSSRLVPKLWMDDVIREFDIRGLGMMSPRRVAAMVQKTLETWWGSADPQVTDAHLPDLPEIEGHGGPIVDIARRMEARMADRSSTFPILHDHYLKAWQLGGGRIPRCDYLLFDEAQDASGAMLDGIRQAMNRGMQVIWIGDTHQEIYRWRGAKNALRAVDCPELPLSMSFRFGEGIANAAADLLSFKPPGLSPIARIRGNPAITSRLSAVRFPYAYLTRTNFGWFMHTVENRVPFTLIGGRKEFDERLKALMQAFGLFRGVPQFDGDFARFPTWEDLVNYIDSTGDPELVFVRKIIETYKTDFPRIMADLRGRFTDDPAMASITAVTAHRAKGLEWSNVRLAEDFVEHDDPDLAFRPLDQREEELNLLYVALTRGQHVVEVNEAFRSVAAAVRSGEDMVQMVERMKREAREAQEAVGSPMDDPKDRFHDALTNIHRQWVGYPNSLKTVKPHDSQPNLSLPANRSQVRSSTTDPRRIQGPTKTGSGGHVIRKVVRPASADDRHHPSSRLPRR
jgi:hypothetical protein